MIKIKPIPRVCPFADVKVGELFRMLKPDIVGEREVANIGLYAKVSTTIAVDVAHDNKDVIPTFKMPCRVMPKAWDVTKLETYQTCQRGKH